MMAGPSDSARLWHYVRSKEPRDEFDLRDATGWGGGMVSDALDLLLIDGHVMEVDGGFVRRKWRLTGCKECRAQARGLGRSDVSFTGRCLATGTIHALGVGDVRTGVGCCRAGALVDLYRRNPNR